jgi:TusA-related sulfurtransferase
VEPDVRAFCDATGHVLLAFEVEEGEYRAHLRKSAG